MTPQGLDGLMAADDSMTADDPIARRYEQTFSIQYDQRSPHSARRLDDAMDEWWRDVRESYNADKKINSERYPL